MTAARARPLCVLAAAVLLSTAAPRAAGNGPAFNLEGRVPASITTAYLEPHYARIARAIAPSHPLDTTPITIIYYAHNDTRKLGVRLPEWGGGGAIGRDTVIIPVDKAPLADMETDRVTLHELVHIALERSFGRLRLPRWFHEGLAMWLSGEISFEEQLVLSRALFAGRLLPLDSIEMVNRFDAYGAALAYSQSHLTLLFIVDSWGMDAIPELLAAVRKTGTFDSAFTQVFGLTHDEFERLAASAIAERYRFLFFAEETWLYWLPGALLVIAGFIAIRLRNKKKLAQMEQEERRTPVILPIRSPAADDAEGDGDDDENEELELNEDGTEPDEDEYDEYDDETREGPRGNGRDL